MALGRTRMFSSLINKFDSGGEMQSGLDDHWTTKSHKIERTWLIEDLQDLAADKSVRVTILRYGKDPPPIWARFVTDSMKAAMSSWQLSDSSIRIRS